MGGKAVAITRDGNTLCTRCGASDWFVCCDDGDRSNPANRPNPRHPYGFCPHCGAEITHRVEVDDLSEYERFREDE